MRWYHLAVVLLLSLTLCIGFIAGQSSAVSFGAGEEIELDVRMNNGDDNNETTMYRDSSFTFTIYIFNFNDSSQDAVFKASYKILGEKSSISGQFNRSTTESVEHQGNTRIAISIVTNTNTLLDFYEFSIKVWNEDDVNMSASVSGRVTVTVLAAPDGDPAIEATSEKSITMSVGGEATIELTITNEADDPDDIEFTLAISDSSIAETTIPPLLDVISLEDNEVEEVSLTVYGLAPGTTTFTFTVTSGNDPDKDAEEQFTITVNKVEEKKEEDKGFLEQEIAGIPLVALFVVIIVVPVVAVVAMGKKKKKGTAGPTVPTQPGMTPGMPAQPGMGAQPGAAQPMVMHCPNCGGVIEIANPAYPQPVQCTHCGSAFQFPGTGQAQAPPQAPPQQQYGAPPQQAGYQTTPCPACGTQIPVPPQRPVTISCPGCASQYQLN